MKRCLCVCMICLLLCGCGAPKAARADVFAMDTVMELKVWAADAKDAEAALGAVEQLLAELEDIWSAVDGDSALSALNRGEDPQWSGEDEEFLQKLESLSRWTGGVFDTKLGALSAAWGFYDDAYRVPAEDEISGALAEEKYDVGAALKGYAGKLAVQELEKMGVSCALLNLGGNVQTYGTKHDGSDWQIGIQNPRGGGTVGIVTVKGTKAVVTSGDYQRYFEEDGVRYHHILDPRTGYPASSGLASVTVIHEDGLLADVLSTALFVMGLEEGIRFWQKEKSFEAVFILDTGEICATDGTALSGCEYEVIGSEK